MRENIHSSAQRHISVMGCLLMALLLLWSFIITPIHAQVERYEILHLTDAIVICEYLPHPRLDTTYVEGNVFIYFNGRTVPFKTYSDYNKYLIADHGSNVYIPECLLKTEEEPIENWLDYNYSYNLNYSEHNRWSPWIKGSIESNDFYKRAGKKTLYVVFAFEGEIVMYKMKRKIIFAYGFNDGIYKVKDTKSSKFAVLKKAEKLRSLTTEEANSMHLKKVEINHIHRFRPD